MTTQAAQPKRFHLCFSIKTLAIVVTLVCCYAACWRVTERQGVSDVYHFAASELGEQGHKTALDFQDFMPEFLSASANTPFLVGLDTFTARRTHRYYLWFFGYVAKLPYERTLPGAVQVDTMTTHSVR